MERYKFHKRNQESSESIAEFIAVIKSLSEHCKFGNYLHTVLRDRLVCGIKDENIQKRLLTEQSLTWEKACLWVVLE